MRNCAPLGPFSRTMSRALWWSWGGGLFLMSEVPLYLNLLACNGRRPGSRNPQVMSSPRGRNLCENGSRNGRVLALWPPQEGVLN